MNKYHATPSRAFGRYFPSRGERDRAQALILKQTAGQITGLRLHPSVELFPGFKWKLDSAYSEGGEEVYEDFKGVMTESVRLKAKVWRYLGPGLLRFVGYNPATRFFFVREEIRPLGIERLLCDIKAKKTA